MIIFNKYYLHNPKTTIYSLKKFTWHTLSQHLGFVVIITFLPISADNRERIVSSQRSVPHHSTLFCSI